MFLILIRILWIAGSICFVGWALKQIFAKLDVSKKAEEVKN